MYHFDKIIDRKKTSCIKYSNFEKMGLKEDALSMWVADMDFETAPEVKERLEKAAAHGIYGYMAQQDDFYDAVTGWFRRRFQWEIEKEWIIHTPGVVFALAAAVRAFTEPGDAVMIQRPVYYPFSMVIEKNDRRIVNNPLILKDGKYVMDYEDMERKMKENRVRLFLLCSPHNPVSRVWTKEELIRLGEICERQGVIIVADEIHCDFVLKGHKHTCFGTLQDRFASRAIICTAPSKTFNLAGLQLSNVVIRDPELRQCYQREMERVMYMGTNLFGQFACQAAYESGEAWLEELLVYLQGNIDFVKGFLAAGLPKVKLIEPEGTYLLWLDFREYGLEADELKDKMLHEAGIWLDEGTMFGEEGAGFMRMNIACPRSIVSDAMLRIQKTFAHDAQI